MGVVPDNISSMVHAFGIRLKKQEIWHPAYEAFCRCGEPYVLTMENLKGITEVQPVGTCVYIVENEFQTHVPWKKYYPAQLPRTAAVLSIAFGTDK